MNAPNRRILIVDDNKAIHDDFRKILVGHKRSQVLIDAEAALFGQKADQVSAFELTSTYQGADAIAALKEARSASRPFAMAFVDVRMPPGLDGIATAARLWEIDPDLQIVVCTAYADHSWTEMTQQLPHPDRWVILRKPFDNIEVLQLAHSLTAKWALLQENREQLEQLEARVHARTQELVKALEDLKRETDERAKAEEEKKTLQRKLEDTQRLESLGVLAGGIAHDFNNILTGILGSASLAKLEAIPGSQVDDSLNRIEKSACRAAELCEQMLAYAGKGQVSLRSIDLNGLVKDTLELIHASVPKDANLELKLAPKLPGVLGDQARMRQVIMNLVINAAEALATAPRRVTLSTHVRELTERQLSAMSFPGEARAGTFVCVEVADTGVGMSAETQRRIFEPFFTTKFAGRGLGLCAVLGIIRARGGALDVESAPGKGSTFRSYFPAERTPVASEVDAPKPKMAKVPAGSTVLVVDDEAPVREVAAAALRRQGYTVLVAGNGAEAISIVQSNAGPLDGVLLDLTMPDMDGVSTLNALRASRPGLRAVLMSGYDQFEALRRFDGLGLTGFLQKPFSVESLREKIGLLRAAAAVA
jgi:two-component system, NtrC family, sensor kinase